MQVRAFAASQRSGGGEDDHIRIQQPRRNLQIKFTRPVSRTNDFVACVDAATRWSRPLGCGVPKQKTLVGLTSLHTSPSIRTTHVDRRRGVHFPADVVYRTHSQERSVNLRFENLSAYWESGNANSQAQKMSISAIDEICKTLKHSILLASFRNFSNPTDALDGPGFSLRSACVRRQGLSKIKPAIAPVSAIAG